MKQIISFCMALLMVLSSVLFDKPIQAQASTLSENGKIIANITLQSESSRKVTLVKQGNEILGPAFKGDESGATQHRFPYGLIGVKDETGTAGYCIEPFARGTSPNGEPQTLDTIPYEQLDDLDKQLLGIMMAGYPNTSYGRTAIDEYMATQVAIQHFVFQHTEKYPNTKKVKFNNDSWSHWLDQIAVIELAKEIYEKGIANPYNPESSSVAVSIDSSNGGIFEEIGDNYELTLSINVDGTFTKGKLAFDSMIKDIVKAYPSSKILVGSRETSFKTGIMGTDDYEEGIEILPGDTTVKIVLEKKAAESYIPFTYQTQGNTTSYEGEKEIEFSFALLGGTAKQAYKGTNANSKNQDYIFFAPGETQPLANKLMLAAADSFTFSEDGGSGGLKILKYNKKTNNLVAGAIFEIRGVSESNWDFLVQIQASPGAAIPLPDGGTATTGTGFIELKDIRPGQYQITELTPPPNFDYCDLGQNSQVVTVREGESSLYPQVRFENNPYGELKLKKIDSVTGSGVNGAVLRIRNPIANIDIEMTTMNGGIIELKNLPEGNYEISEVFCPNQYVKSDEVKTATIRWGETTEITYENTSKTEVYVKKISDTGDALEGALIRLTKPDTGDVYEDTTYYDGYVVFSNIPSGTYVLEELLSPEGYIRNEEKFTIVVEAYKQNEFFITNYKKPKLEILKLDAEDNITPLEGALFRITFTDGKTVYEETSGPDGKIVLENLEPGVYSIEELSPPKGFLLPDNPHKDIRLEPGDEIQLVWTNKSRPRLRLQKVDINTGELLKNSEFRVRKVEEETLSEYILENGEIILENLEEAIYEAYEYVAPEGYIIVSEDRKQILTESGKTKTLKFDNIRKPVAVFQKTNGLTGAGIPGAKYKVEYEMPNGSIKNLGSYTTNSDGKIIIPKAEVGWYVFTETMPAPGFSLPSNPVTRQYFGPGDNAYLPSTEHYYASSGTGKYASGSAPDDGHTEQSNGNGSSSNGSNTDGTNSGNNVLPSGIEVHYGNEYYIEGEGYNWPLNAIVIKKSDINTGELLPSATFELYKADGQVSGQPGTLIATVTTDHSGVCVITGLESGYYVVKESIPPPFYLIAETNMQNGFLKPDGTTVLEFSFRNIPYGHILITKQNKKSLQPVADVKVQVTDGAGAAVGNSNGIYYTDALGEILIENIPPGTYLIRELESVPGYALTQEPTSVTVGTDGGIYTVRLFNEPLGSLVIRKWSSADNTPLPNAEFFVKYADGTLIGPNNGLFKTNEQGTIVIDGLYGSVVVEEKKAPDGFLLTQQTEIIEIGYGESKSLDFFNAPLSNLTVFKYTSSNEPIPNTRFQLLKKSGEIIPGNFTTNNLGYFEVSGLEPGWYSCYELSVDEPYILDSTPQDFEITSNQSVTLQFWNNRKSSLTVYKWSNNLNPLGGSRFRLEKQSGELVEEFTIPESGQYHFPALEAGHYRCFETKAAPGYELNSEPQHFEISSNQELKLDFYNNLLGSILIRKSAESDSRPLGSVLFSVERQNGQLLYEGETDSDGTLLVPSLEPGFYVVREKRTQSDKFLLDETPKVVEVKANSITQANFTNREKSGLIVYKYDQDRDILAGVTMRIVKVPSNEIIGDFTTNEQGFFTVEHLEPGTYSCFEIQGLSTHEMDSTAQIFKITNEQLVRLEFINVKIGGLHVKKISSLDRSVVPNTTFSLSTLEGTKLGEYKTSSDGTFFVSLGIGTYVLQEVKAAENFIEDSEPIIFEIKTEGEIVYREIENTPVSSFLLIKTDAQTKKPIESVSFEFRKENGELLGIYKTDSSGRIYLDNLPSGKIHVVEKEQKPGYELDTQIYEVTISPGKQSVLRVENKPLAGLRLYKYDSVTGNPIYNTEFMVFDHNNKVVGTFYTDDRGIIDFSAILTEGRYTIRETRPSPGYYPDDQPRTVEFVASKVTEIRWANTPMSGQVQITKLSEDDNEVNGLSAGTPLEGAIFEVYEYKTGNLVDRFVTAANGRGVSQPLPLGRYLIKEVQAPSFYQLNSKEMDITIEFATQIIKLDYTNKSANTGVTIKKTGNTEAMPGDVIRYDIKTIKNDSSIPLTDFYWRDVLPVDAVRLNKIITGTYNQSLRYKIIATTNKGNTIVIADNLSTTQNNVIDCSNASLGLFSDEVVTSFTCVFGNVKAGFTSVEQPQVFVQVLKTLPTGYEFANKCDLGGKSGNEWIIGNSTWVTRIYRSTSDKLPKTGY